MRRVIIESPYAGDLARNEAYLIRCFRDAITRGEVPLASHLLYTRVLNDAIQSERLLGIQLGYSWWPFAESIVFYTDYGMSNGMQMAYDKALAERKPYEFRVIGIN